MADRAVQDCKGAPAVRRRPEGRGAKHRVTRDRGAQKEDHNETK